MTPQAHIEHAEMLAAALSKFQQAHAGAEKDAAKAAYLAIPQLTAPEHDQDIVDAAMAGDKTAMALLHME